MITPNDPIPKDDDLWDTLDHASTSTPSPSFVNNTVRAARLSEPSYRKPWWMKLLARPQALAFSSCLLLAIGFITMIQSRESSEASQLATTTHTSITANEDDTWIEETLLIAALDSPELFSEAELVALIF